MQTLTAAAVYSSVAQDVESIKNDEHALIPDMEPGDCVRQGDVYIIAVDVQIKGSPYAGRQLAMGTTQGSRHIAEAPAELVTVDEDRAAEILNRLIPSTRGQQLFFGPAIYAAEPWTVSHPEHGDRTLPAGNYLVTHQRTWANEVRRQQD
jgi:hypothetical protein